MLFCKNEQLRSLLLINNFRVKFFFLNWRKIQSLLHAFHRLEIILGHILVMGTGAPHLRWVQV